MSEYQIKMKPLGHLKRFRGYCLIFLVMSIYVLFIDQSFKNIQATLFSLLVAAFFMFGPALPLYINHLKLSMGVKLLINSNDRTLLLETRSFNYNFSFDEVLAVRGILSPPKAERRSVRLPMGEFFYFNIELKNNQTIIVTCLMVDDSVLESDLFNINGAKPKIIKKFFPHIRFPKSDILNLQ